MKHLIALVALMSLFFGKASSQITLEYTSPVPQSFIYPVALSANGTKWVIQDTGSNTLKLCNADYSVWRTIPIAVPVGMRVVGVSHVSDHLFNTDDQVEAVVTFQYTITPFTANTIIMSEAGATILDLGPFNSTNVVYMNGAHKLVTFNGATRISKIYNLPGELPCGHCGVMGIPKSPSTSGQAIAPTVYPNPAGNNITIVHGLPATASGMLTINGADGRSFGTWPVSGKEPQLTIDVKNFPAGFYNITVLSEGAQPVFSSFVR